MLMMVADYLKNSTSAGIDTMSTSENKTNPVITLVMLALLVGVMFSNGVFGPSPAPPKPDDGCDDVTPEIVISGDAAIAAKYLQQYADNLAESYESASDLLVGDGASDTEKEDSIAKFHEALSQQNKTARERAAAGTIDTGLQEAYDSGIVGLKKRSRDIADGFRKSAKQIKSAVEMKGSGLPETHPTNDGNAEQERSAKVAGYSK